MEQSFDVIIIGAGPGGTAAAKVLATAGKKVALLEDKELGGVCLNCGCIPTKFFLAATAPLGLLHDHKRFGSVTGELAVDFAALQKRKNRFVKGSSSALGKSLQSLGVTLFQGRGECTAPGAVSVHGETQTKLLATDIILATGSHSASFPGLEPDGDTVLDSTMTLALESVPASMIIVGAGAIGMEFSDFFSAVGTKVTLVEGMPQLLPTEDKDIASEMEKIVKKSGVDCHTGRKVMEVKSVDGGAELIFEDDESLRAEKVIVAVGRKANTQGLGITTAGGKLSPRGFASINESLEVAPHCYAIGDLNGLTLLAHAAEHQGEWVARRILGKENGAYVSGPVPSCVFGHIEVMRVGKTAKEAVQAGGNVSVSSAPFSVNPIAQAHGSSVGLAKAVWENDRLVGMAALGHNASHLVSAAQLLVLHGHTPESLHTFMFAHPTLDEILKSALLAGKTAYEE